MAIGNLKRHKSARTDQIPAELINARGRMICSEIHKVVNSSGRRRNCLSSGRSQTLYLFIQSAIKQNIVIMEAYHL
jgi:hypothetical protein